MPRALRNGERIRGSIHILILNIFGYETIDLVVESIHLHSETLVQFKSRQFFFEVKINHNPSNSFVHLRAFKTFSQRTCYFCSTTNKQHLSLPRASIQAMFNC